MGVYEKSEDNDQICKQCVVNDIYNSIVWYSLSVDKAGAEMPPLFLCIMLLWIDNIIVVIKQQVKLLYVLKMVHVPCMPRRVRLLPACAAPPAWKLTWM
jgi:hypothetical protein